MRRLLEVRDLEFAYGDRLLISGLSFTLEEGSRCGIVGPNGAGKSTLLRLLSGRLRPDGGSIRWTEGVRSACLTQEPDLQPQRTVLETAEEGLQEWEALKQRLHDLEEQLAGVGPDADPERAGLLLDRYERAQNRFEAAGGYALEHRPERVLRGLGFGSRQLHQPAGSLSGGEQVRLSLARLLVAEPEVMLLDEPTNHLDMESIAWLEAFLTRSRSGILIVSHDRSILTRAVDRILEVEEGRARVYRGNYPSYLEQRRQREEAAVREQERLAAERARLQSFVDRFSAGTRAAQAQSRKKQLERLQAQAGEAAGEAAPVRRSRVDFRLVTPAMLRERSPALEVERLGHRYVQPGEGPAPAEGRSKERGWLFRDFSARVVSGERILIAGRNGSGKSTLLRILAGLIQPAEGSARWNERLRLGYFAQERVDLDPGRSALELLLDAGASGLQEAWGRLARFGLTGVADQPAGALSGGERGRLAMAALTLKPADCLLLDEPTNHLDLPSREGLEASLKAYPGVLFLITHDRALAEALATRVWHVGDGRVEDLPGWEAYARRLESASGTEAAKSGSSAGEAAGSARGAAGGQRTGVAGGGLRQARKQAEARERGLRPLRRALAAAEQRLAALEAEREKLEARLSDPALYSSGDEEAQKTVARHRQVVQEAEQAEAEWLELAQRLEAAQEE